MSSLNNYKLWSQSLLLKVILILVKTWFIRTTNSKLSRTKNLKIFQFCKFKDYNWLWLKREQFFPVKLVRWKELLDLSYIKSFPEQSLHYLSSLVQHAVLSQLFIGYTQKDFFISTFDFQGRSKVIVKGFGKLFRNSWFFPLSILY